MKANPRWTMVVGGLAVVLAIPNCVSAKKPKVNSNWPSFRGPNAQGVSDGFPLPTAWTVGTSEGVKWKTPIPGLAHSSPIIWGERLFVTTVTSENSDPKLRVGLYGESPDHPEEYVHQYRLFCLQKETGEILWSRVAFEGLPKVKRHIKGTHANCTPTTDGRFVVAFFGSQGLYCYDMEGELVWSKEFGLLDAGPPGYGDLQWGFASSPVIDDGRVYVQCDARNNSFVAALKLGTGKEIWRTPREEDGTWSTPTVHKSRKRKQLIVNGYKHIGGYDLRNGKELWKLAGGGDIPVPTPVVAHDLIFINNAHGGLSPILAISIDAKGTLALNAEDSEYVVWSKRKGGSYMQTPLIYGDELYMLRGNGSLACYDALTGERHYRQRVGSGAAGYGYTASGVAADGKLYFPSEEGEIHVVKAGKEYELLAVNDMGEICMASPAVSRGTMFFRTLHHLVAVAKMTPAVEQGEAKKCD